MRWAWALVSIASLLAGCKGDPVASFNPGTDTDSDTDSDSDVDAGDPAEACDPSAKDWPAEWADLEVQLMDLVNDVRAEGADCGDAGVFEATAPLTMEPHLRCAARVHSLDMGMRNYFGHDSPDGPLGDDLFARISNSGYEGFALGENIAAGQDAADTVGMWAGSGEQCAKLMNPDATETGVGYASVEGSSWTKYWTQDMGVQ
jgi:uncharacterized protein YkwD